MHRIFTWEIKRRDAIRLFGIIRVAGISVNNWAVTKRGMFGRVHMAYNLTGSEDNFAALNKLLRNSDIILNYI